MESVGSGGDPTFLDYLRPVWRYKYAVVLLVALAAVGTYLYTNRQAKVYQASTQVYVGKSALQQTLNPNGGGGGGGANTLADEATLVTTPAVANAVKTNLKLPYPADALLGEVTAAPATGADFIIITAQAGNPKLAAELANGFAAGYLQVTRGSIVSGAQAELSAAQSRLKRLSYARTNDAIRGALATQISTLQSDIASTPSVGTQVTPAVPNPVAISPKPTRNAVFAGALALVLGIIIAYLFDRRDRRIRSFTELESLFEAPVLATVPHVRRTEPTDKDTSGIPVALREPHRTLRVNLEIARGQRETKVILITSALPSEGKSTIVRNLAITYRDAGARVAVVEADLRRPVLAQRFGVDQQPGLSEALAHHKPPRMQRVPEGLEVLNGGAGAVDVLVAGGAPDDPTVLLSDERLAEVLEGLADSYDLVLVDSPPLLVVGDGLPLLGLVDGVVIVARAGVLTHPAATRLRRTIDRVNRIKRFYVLGAVVNDIADEIASYSRPYGKSSRAGATEPVAPSPQHAAS